MVVLLFGFIPMGSLILALVVSHGLLKQANFSPRAYWGALLAITLLPIFLLAFIGFGWMVASYHGTCYGFTDGSWNCSLFEYLGDNLFWGAFFIVPLALLHMPVCVGVFLAAWLQFRRGKVGLPVPVLPKPEENPCQS